MCGVAVCVVYLLLTVGKGVIMWWGLCRSLMPRDSGHGHMCARAHVRACMRTCLRARALSPLCPCLRAFQLEMLADIGVSMSSHPCHPYHRTHSALVSLCHPGICLPCGTSTTLRWCAAGDCRGDEDDSGDHGHAGSRGRSLSPCVRTPQPPTPHSQARLGGCDPSLHQSQ